MIEYFVVQLPVDPTGPILAFQRSSSLTEPPADSGGFTYPEATPADRDEYNRITQILSIEGRGYQRAQWNGTTVVEPLDDRNQLLITTDAAHQPDPQFSRFPTDPFVVVVGDGVDEMTITIEAQDEFGDTINLNGRRELRAFRDGVERIVGLNFGSSGGNPPGIATRTFRRTEAMRWEILSNQDFAVLYRADNADEYVNFSAVVTEEG